MTKVRFTLELDVNNANGKAALIELRRWKTLIEEGEKNTYQLELKKTVLAGLYLQKAVPDLAEKLAENLSIAAETQLDHFYNASCSSAQKSSLNEQQNDIMLSLQTLKMDIQQFLSDSAVSELKQDNVLQQSKNKNINSVLEKSLNDPLVSKKVALGTDEKITPLTGKLKLVSTKTNNIISYKCNAN